MHEECARDMAQHPKIDTVFANMTHVLGHQEMNSAIDRCARVQHTMKGELDLVIAML